jgi:hypothetical protein
MEMENKVTALLKEYATRNGYKVFDNKYGDITFNSSNNTFEIVLNAGNIYGILVQLDPKYKNLLWNEVASKTKIKDINNFIPVFDDWFPLYWGKDVQGAQRVYAHIKGHKNNGNINMPLYSTLKKVNILYGSITVDNYVMFEKVIMNQFAPLLGTLRNGSMVITKY